MRTIINLTPHVVRLNDGTEFAPSGTVARVTAVHEEQDRYEGLRIFTVLYGKVEGLPPESDAPDAPIYIVSGLVLQAINGRHDVVAPATGHPSVVRREGQIHSVPGFVQG